MLPPKLDYLFVAEFKDGTKYHQTPADASVEHPLTRSAFWDVLQRLDQVKTFALIDRHHQHEHKVFLDDGRFVTDGTVLTRPASPELHNFRLIYFRRVAASMEAGCASQPEVENYFLGWQANDPQGKNFQMILRIPPLGSLQKPNIETK